MDAALFEQLLYEEEDTVLDFKVEQYKFSGSTDNEKSELLKDILGFANAWRRSDAYILIGVREVRGGRSEVIGISSSEHLDDHSAQQFVNSRTNQAIAFSYKAFSFEGKQVGIIKIEQQNRPFYLTKDFGKLKKEQVYIRRGSSTNPQKPAPLEEIARMNSISTEPLAELLVEFVDLKTEDVLGTCISLKTEFRQMPPQEKIPDLVKNETVGGYAIQGLGRIDSNPAFFREMANYIKSTRLVKPVRLVIENIGQSNTSNVTVEIRASKIDGNIAINESRMPERPSPDSPRMPEIQFSSGRYSGDVVLEENDDNFLLKIDCGELQPGRKICSDPFYVGKIKNGDLVLNGIVFASNLPKPQYFTLSAKMNVTQSSMSVEDITRITR